MKSFAVRLFTICLLLASMSACQKVDFDTDVALIEAIESATNKTVIDATELPPTAQGILDEFYSESFTDEVLFAEDFGYQVERVRDRSSRIGERIRLFFDRQGRQLRRERTERTTDRHVHDGTEKRECFHFVYPISLIMPDRTTITGNSVGDIATKLRRWYHANPRYDVRAQLQYPVTVEFPANDRTGSAATVVVNNETEMERVRARCD